jgi:hypothetical protein
MYREVRGIDHLSVDLCVLIRPATVPARSISVLESADGRVKMWATSR